jgi:Family of unknown function (DUF5330)
MVNQLFFQATGFESKLRAPFHPMQIRPCYNSPITTGTPKGDAMGMLRTLCVVVGAVALMPSPPPEVSGQAAPQGPGAFAYVAAAAETVADMRSFCQRNPAVCSTAGVFAQTLEGKAKYSVKLVYEWANEATGDGHPRSLPPDMAMADPIQTSAPAAARLAASDSQNTLTLADIVPEWQKPRPGSKG